MPLNVKLLRQVKKHILAEPKRLRMDTWIKRGMAGETAHFSSGGYGEPTECTIPDCGTVGCIAGWVTLLGKPDEHLDFSVESAARALLDYNPYFQPFSLFFADHWPMAQQQKYYDAKTAEDRAKIVGQVIDIYIREYNKKEKQYEARYNDANKA